MGGLGFKGGLDKEGRKEEKKNVRIRDARGREKKLKRSGELPGQRTRTRTPETGKERDRYSTE